MLAVDEDSAPRSIVGHPMRIALCHKRLDEREGTERDFHLTAKGLRDLGHEIHLFCNKFTIEPPSGTFAHKMPVLPFNRTAELWSFALHAPKIIQKFNCDVIVSFGRMMAQDVLRSGVVLTKYFFKDWGNTRDWDGVSGKTSAFIIAAY